MAATKKPREDWGAKTIQRTISVYPGDARMTEELKEFLGTTSLSDVHRTAIRTLYVKLLGKNA